MMKLLFSSLKERFPLRPFILASSINDLCCWCKFIQCDSLKAYENIRIPSPAINICYYLPSKEDTTSKCVLFNNIQNEIITNRTIKWLLLLTTTTTTGNDQQLVHTTYLPNSIIYDVVIFFDENNCYIKAKAFT